MNVKARPLSVVVTASVARRALRTMTTAERSAILWCLNLWLRELDAAELTGRYAPRRVAALKLRTALRASTRHTETPP